jgi:hypothetical protein
MNTRDLLNHGSGKGDKPRTKLDENYLRRFSEIAFPKRTLTESGFKKVGRKFVKSYG